jgi:hypothetical protein
MEEFGHRHRAGHGQRGRPAIRGTNMKTRKGRFSGKIGNEVYVNSKYGQVVRSRPGRAGRAKENLPIVASAWRSLTDFKFLPHRQLIRA